MKDNVPEQFSREMGLTLTEFQRTLPAAINPLACHLEERQFSIYHPQGTVLIKLHETGERKIASMRLPVTRVDFQFIGLDADERKSFMGRFDLYFHRGGG